MLCLEQVSVAYGPVAAVEDVSLELPEGEVLAVLGPSGCGKSTLLRAVAGLEPLARGRIHHDGRDLHGVPTHKRGFALLFQDGQLFGHRSVAANIAYALRIRHHGRSRTRARVAELLELVGLAGYADRMPATLSGGEQQRVALARALAVEPRVLLLDEPLSALDKALREHLAEELREILTRSGTTALLVTHDHEEAFAVADRMALMRRGRVVQEGTLAEVWGGPADAEAAGFLGYASVLEGAAAAKVLAAAGLAAGSLAAGSLAAGDGAATDVVALRRSALQVRAGGALRGVVLSSRLTPERLRLDVDVEGIGVLGAVSPGGDKGPGVGETVRLDVDPERLAVVGGR